MKQKIKIGIPIPSNEYVTTKGIFFEIENASIVSLGLCLVTKADTGKESSVKVNARPIPIANGRQSVLTRPSH